jgi:predicted enzyme related to lactoylglutathione lyase
MTRFAHVNIVARDWRSLAGFYVEVFGCAPKPPERDLRGDWLDDLTALKGAHIRGIHLVLPGGGDAGPTLEIFEYEKRRGRGGVPGVNKPGLAHLAFVVDDLRRTLAKMERRGGRRVGRVVTTVIPGAGALKLAYARDPEGNIVELQQRGA